MSDQSTHEEKRGTSAARRWLDIVALGVTIGIAWFLWPSFLGGSSQLILVQGHSMEPTYAPGELVFLDTDATPDVGRVVVFRIPDDQPAAGQLVVHRIIGMRADGTYVTQGDNSPNPDEFRIGRTDILGVPRFAIPGGGHLIALLSSPMGIGGATGLMSMAVLWPRKRPVHLDAPEIAGLEIGADGWSSLAISEQVRAEADAWLQSQLAQVP